MSGNKELRHFKISNKNPSATLRSGWWLEKVGGVGSGCPISEQGMYGLWEAEWMHRQEQQQAGNTVGETHFLPSSPQV